MMKGVFLCYFLFSFIFLRAQVVRPDSRYHLIGGSSYVQSKNCYLLTLFEENKAVRKLPERNIMLPSLAIQRNKSLQN